MPVRFVLGRAGTGKTRYFLEQIEELVRAQPLGPPIYLLLPKQATFQAERELTCRLGGFTRVRVVSFDQLGKDILADCGDVGIPEVTTLGRQMIVGHLLRKHQKQLKFYSASATRPGLAAELDSTFGEFERAGFDAQALDELLHQLEPREESAFSLRDKLHDISLLIDAYNAHIGQDKLDPQRRLKRILESVSRCSTLKKAVVFVDDFFDFSGYEQKLLTAVAASALRTEISLLLDPKSPTVVDPRSAPDELSTFHRTERTYRLLYRSLSEAAVKLERPVLSRETHRFKSRSLGDLERGLFTTEPQRPQETFGGDLFSSVPVSRPKAGDDIRFIEAADARTEVDAVARRIRLALREGYRLRDIAVLTRDLGKYADIVDASFREHQFLPYFADRRRTATHHPLLQFVRSCILIALHGWPHDAVMSLLKSGLAGIADERVDELENYVVSHRIRGKMWMSNEPWGFRRELTRERDDALAETLTETSAIDVARKEVVSKLRPFIACVTAKEHSFRTLITELFTLLEAFGVRRTLSTWMKEAEAANEFEQRNEHEQVWSELVDLFEQMSGLLGDEKVALGDFLEVLDNGLETFDLALAPPKVDQILVGQIDRTRTPDVKLVFVLGLNEGDFPRLQKEKGVLWDSERKSLRKRNIDLDPDTERQLLDERLLAYVAFTRASNRLVLARNRADDKGRVCNPSSYWNELRRLFPDAQLEKADHPSKNDPDAVGTPRQLVTSLMRWARTGGSNEGPWPALYQWLAAHECCDDAIDLMRFRSWKALSYNNAAALSPEIAGQLFPNPLQASISQIESFAACPFQHFLRHGLNLRSREEPDLTVIDLSRAYHQVLENVVKDVLQSRKDFCELEPDAAADMIRTYTAEIGRTLRGELMLSTARNRYILDRIERSLTEAVESQRETSRRGQFRPKFASVKFGEGQALPPYRIETPAHHEVQLRGKIDRVDLDRAARTFAILDYKLASSSFSLNRAYYGLSLQLLVYLLVMQEGAEKLVGHKLAPAAAFFLQLLRTTDLVEHPDDAKSPDHPDFHLRKLRGIIDARVAQSFDAATQTGRSQVVSFHVKKDGAFGNLNNTDVADEEQFKALLGHVQKRIGELADQLISGDIRIYPHWLARDTPCARCEFRSVCRFEPNSDKYNMMPPMRREDVLRKVTDGGNDGDK